MAGQSPEGMRASSDLDRMQVLLAATGLPAPITTPSFPVVKLDVEACYHHLNTSQKQRPEDLAMRQALELYCSLMSPPTSPTLDFQSPYPSKQDQMPVTPSGIFTCEEEYRPSSILYDEPKARDYDPATDPNRSFGFGSPQTYSRDGNSHASQTDQNHYSWSTPSFVSDHENSDTDDMDDPFACYPLSYLRNFTPQINYHHHRRSSYEISSHVGPHSYASQQRFPISAQPLIGQLEGSLGMGKAASADARSARATFISPHIEPTAPQTKPSVRKRSFSVVTFVKQRKPSSGSANSLRIFGPTPTPNSTSGTFSGPARTSRSSGGQLPGCLSPALEANEDITPVKPIPSKPIPTRKHSNYEIQSAPQDMNSLYSSRPDAKSLWKTLKTSSTRPSFAYERPVIPHFNH